MPNLLANLWQRTINAEAMQMAGWFRIYYYANQKNVEASARDPIERLLAQRTISRAEVSQLVGLLMDASSLFGLERWRETLRYEYSLLLNRGTAEADAIECKTGDANLRTEVAMLAGQVARLRSTRRSLSVMRNSICGVGLLVAIAYLVSAAAWYRYAQHRDPWFMLVCGIALMGGLGGFTSGLSRLYSIEWRGPSLLMYTHVASLFWGLMLNLVLASFQGMVFALVITAIFTGGLIEGALFPRLTSRGVVSGLIGVFSGEIGLAAADIAKAMAWAFIAGFSERLVPDLMRQLSNQAREAGPVRPTGPADALVTGSARSAAGNTVNSVAGSGGSGTNA